MILHPVAVASDVDDMAVVHKAVDESRRHHLVAQHAAPVLETLVRRQHSRRLLVPGVDELEEEHGAVLVDRQLADLVDHQQSRMGEHALLVFRQIMNHAISRGHIETNPTRGLKRNPRPKLTRFLSREEIGRLHKVLDRYEPRRTSGKAQVDIIRLLLLTGCRTGEIMKLRWREVGGDTLELEDSKTGPRQVLLSPEARSVIGRQPRSGSPWVFPSPMNPARARFDISLWKKVRKLAGIEDVRLHDLRHTYAA